MKERQDAWLEQDDLILAQTILSHIRNGSTQLAAFEEAAEKLNRTSAACGFRWNNEVRKRYSSEIAEAKAYRSQNKKAQKKADSRPLVAISNTNVLENDPVYVTDFAEQIMQAARNLKKQHDNMTTRIKTLSEELKQAKEEIETLKNKLIHEAPETAASDDYQALLQILSRARSLGVLDKLSS